MQLVIIVVLCVVVLVTFAIQPLGVPAPTKYVAELLSGVAALYVVLAGPRKKFQLVQGKYWLMFGALICTIICGSVANGVDTGPTFAGIRSFTRAIPFFLLPAVMEISDRDIRKQLKILIVLALIQVPVAIHQRWVVMSEGRFTGDNVMGTLEESGALSLFMTCSVFVLTGFFLRRQIGRLSFIVLALIFLIPTTINETKVTILLFPLGLLATVIVGSPRGRRLRVVGWASALIVGFGAMFIPIYDYMQRNNPYPQEVSLELLTDPRRNYLTTDNAGVGATSYVGRGDALAISMEYISEDPVRLVFGLGMGNASMSALGEIFTGEYGRLFENVMISDISVFVLELGILGAALVLILYWLIFRDAMVVARGDNDIRAAIAIGWAGIAIVMAISVAYKVTHEWASLSYLYWYFAGLIAAWRAEIATKAQAPQAVETITFPTKAPHLSMDTAK